MLGLSYPNPLEPLHAFNEVWTKPDTVLKKQQKRLCETVPTAHRG